MVICLNPECPDRQAAGEPRVYRDGLTVCPACDEPLTDAPSRGEPSAGLEPRARVGTVDPGRMAGAPYVLLRTRRFAEADLVAAALEEAGIRHSMANGRFSRLALGGGGALLAPGLEVSILVHSDVVAEAEDVLSSVLGARIMRFPVSGTFPSNRGGLRVVSSLIIILFLGLAVLATVGILSSLM